VPVIQSENLDQKAYQIIKEMIENNTSEKKLSDQKISDMLKKQGISIARRTVAKYRNELDIDSSYMR